MGIRDSFSRLKKKLNHLRRKQKPGRTAADVDEEIVDPADPLARPEPHIIVGDGEGHGGSGGGPQAYRTDGHPQPDKPELVPASGSENDQRGGRADVHGREVGQMDSHRYPDVEVAVGSGPSREGVGADEENIKRVYPSSSTHPFPGSGKPNSM